MAHQLPHRSTAALLIALTLLPLAACGSKDEIARSIGLVRDAPDEFTVTTRAPLSMPPDYSLRPPTPGVQRPQEQTPRQAAEATLAPQASLSAASAGMSPGQQAFLAAAGPAAPADIRTKVNQSAAMDGQDVSLTDRLMFWKAKPPAGTALDPKLEAQRLRANAALGQPLDTGDTPIIQRDSAKSWYESLF